MKRNQYCVQRKEYFIKTMMKLIINKYLFVKKKAF